MCAMERSGTGWKSKSVRALCYYLWLLKMLFKDSASAFYSKFSLVPFLCFDFVSVFFYRCILGLDPSQSCMCESTPSYGTLAYSGLVLNADFHRWLAKDCAVTWLYKKGYYFPLSFKWVSKTLLISTVPGFLRLTFISKKY